MAGKSRAEYFRKRRERRGQFSVEVDKDKLAELDSVLGLSGKTKTQWLDEMIEESLRTGQSREPALFFSREMAELIRGLSREDVSAVTENVISYYFSGQVTEKLENEKAILAFEKFKNSIDWMRSRLSRT